MVNSRVQYKAHRLYHRGSQTDGLFYQAEGNVGRPKKIINQRTLYGLAKIHCTYREMADILGCDPDTLHDRFSVLIQNGRAKGKMSLRRLQYAAAKRGHTGMLIWLGKQQLGQSEYGSSVSDAEKEADE